MSSRFATSRASRSSDSSAVASSSAWSLGGEGDLGAAKAGDGGLRRGERPRRSWLTAASSAVRIRSASASGRAASASSTSRSWRSATTAWAANASTIRRSSAASGCPRTRVYTAVWCPSSTAIGPPPRPRSVLARVAADVAAIHQRPGLAGGRDRCPPTASGAALEQGDGFQAQRLAELLEQRR